MIDFRIHEQDGLSIHGYLKVNEKELQLPNIFFSNYALRDRVWKYGVDIDGILFSAHLLEHAPFRQDIYKKGIHRALDFNHLIMMDSGGFRNQSIGDWTSDPSIILDIYHRTTPDLGLCLDLPCNSSDPPEVRHEKIRVTVENLEWMLSGESEIPIIPVIHGYEPETINYVIEQIDRIIEKEEEFNPLYSVGFWNTIERKSARMVKSINFLTKDGIKRLVHTRRRLGECFIHALGIGGILTAPLLYFLGVSTLDSTSYISNAAYGAIFILGEGTYYITEAHKNSKRKRPSLSEDDFHKKECPCPICKNHQFSELQHSRKLRLLHNAWCLQETAREAQRAIEQGYIRDWVREILEGTYYYTHFSYAKKLLVQKKLV